MGRGASARLLAIVDALPLRKGIRVLEIGCGPGAAAREIARRIGRGQVLGIDRSATRLRRRRQGLGRRSHQAFSAFVRRRSKTLSWRRAKRPTISPLPCVSVRWMAATRTPRRKRSAGLPPL